MHKRGLKNKNKKPRARANRGKRERLKRETRIGSWAFDGHVWEVVDIDPGVVDRTDVTPLVTHFFAFYFTMHRIDRSLYSGDLQLSCSAHDR